MHSPPPISGYKAFSKRGGTVYIYIYIYKLTPAAGILSPLLFDMPPPLEPLWGLGVYKNWPQSEERFDSLCA